MFEPGPQPHLSQPVVEYPVQLCGRAHGLPDTGEVRMDRGYPSIHSYRDQDPRPSGFLPALVTLASVGAVSGWGDINVHAESIVVILRRDAVAYQKSIRFNRLGRRRGPDASHWVSIFWHGDKKILQDQYPTAKRWVDHLEHRAPTRKSLWRRLFGNLGEMENYIVDAGYDWAKRLRPGESPEYNVFYQIFGLLQPEHISPAVNRLVDLIEQTGYHLGTGFMSTVVLLPALTAHGRADVAFRLLLQDTKPSWLGILEKGATTLWETWIGYDAKGEAYYSHNHYALGAFCYLAGGVVGWAGACGACVPPDSGGARYWRWYHVCVCFSGHVIWSD